MSILDIHVNVHSMISDVDSMIIANDDNVIEMHSKNEVLSKIVSSLLFAIIFIVFLAVLVFLITTFFGWLVSTKNSSFRSVLNGSDSRFAPWAQKSLSYDSTDFDELALDVFSKKLYMVVDRVIKL